LDGDDAFIARKLSEAVGDARSALRAKRFTMREIVAEEEERMRKLTEAGSKKALEREHFRKSYSTIQAFIDRQFGG
jgi:hypothetical protein